MSDSECGSSDSSCSDSFTTVADSDGSATETISTGSVYNDDDNSGTGRRGSGSRVMRSLLGLIIGPALVFAGLFLLFSNEGDVVHTLQALDEAKSVTVSVPSAPVLSRNEGQLLHVSGELRVAVPVSDPLFGITTSDVRLHRVVEMFQWSEAANNNSIEYNKTWSEAQINSDNFKIGYGHVNPSMPIPSETFNNANIKLGDFSINPDIINVIRFFEPLALVSQQAPKAPFRRVGNYLFRGANPGQPQVGDLRVRYEVVTPQRITVVAQQDGGMLSPYKATDGSSFHWVIQGFGSIETIYSQAVADAQFNAWLMRACGFILLLVAPMVFLRPLTSILSFVPLVGGFVAGLIEGGIFFASLLISLPLALIVIAIAWLVFRPAIAIALLVAAVLAAFGVTRWRRSRVARVAS